ncbi:MAG: glutaminase A [Stomatobaculum sp.]
MQQTKEQAEEGAVMEQDIQKILEEALVRGRSVLIEGKVASYIPELAKADSSNLGCCIMKADGTIYKAGDYNIPFTMQSISKTFSLILALQTAGYDRVFSKVGMEPTGDRFDSILQLELKDWRPFNPMINAGAIVTADCIDAEKPFEAFLALVRKLCGDSRIHINEAVYQSEKRTGTRNRSIAYLLKSDNVLDKEPEEVLDVYFRMCSVMATAKNLAHYAMVLANKGRDPQTEEQLIDPEIVKIVTTLMMLCGMYDESGEYAVKVGLPSKSGVGGGIVAVGPDGTGIGTFGPMLNRKGNSVGGEKMLQYLSQQLRLHMFM